MSQIDKFGTHPREGSMTQKELDKAINADLNELIKKLNENLAKLRSLKLI